MEIFRLKDQTKELNLSKSTLTKALKDSKSLITFLEEEKEEVENDSEERINELEAQLKALQERTTASSSDLRAATKRKPHPGLRTRSVANEDKENCVYSGK
jgi:peptidoglycan hydrolase CwlO-like protein